MQNKNDSIFSETFTSQFGPKNFMAANFLVVYDVAVSLSNQLEKIIWLLKWILFWGKQSLFVDQVTLSSTN